MVTGNPRQSGLSQDKSLHADMHMNPGVAFHQICIFDLFASGFPLPSNPPSPLWPPTLHCMQSQVFSCSHAAEVANFLVEGVTINVMDMDPHGLLLTMVVLPKMNVESTLGLTPFSPTLKT